MTIDAASILRVAAIMLGAAPVIHTEWNKYQLKRFEKGTSAAAELDNKIKKLRDRRARQGSEWKGWKSACIVVAIISGAVSFYLTKVF